jgi:hypothetical protein
MTISIFAGQCSSNAVYSYLDTHFESWPGQWPFTFFSIITLEFQYFCKLSLPKWDARMWIGLIWLRIGSSDVLLDMGVSLKVP